MHKIGLACAVASLLFGSANLPDQQVWAEDSVAVNQGDYKTWVLDAERLREQGDLIAAQQRLDLALQLAESKNLPPQELAAVELAQGYNAFLLDKKELAEQRLKAAYGKTAETGYLRALADQYLAYLYLSNGEVEQAKLHIDNGLAALKSTQHNDLKLSLELSRPLDSTEKPDQHARRLLTIGQQVADLPGQAAKSKLSLKVVQQILDRVNQSMASTQRAALQKLSYQLLDELLRLPATTISAPIKADATGKLAQLYHWQGRDDEALGLLSQALATLETGKNRELSAQLAAQQGVILNARGDREGALSAYARAVADLRQIRTEMPITLADGRSTLSALIEPIHRNYADLLLKSTASGQAKQQVNDAVDSMEAIKEADMQDFFLGRCSIAQANNQDWKNQVFAGATVFYPILLPDRIELVLKTDQEVTRLTVPVRLDQVKKQIDVLTDALHSGKDYRASSKQLYDWLVRPAQDVLQKAGNSVVVYVPDSYLRAVPLSVLNDGKSFVVERYSVVTLPGLALQNLLRQREEKRVQQSLLAGLSKPNPATLDQLPDDLVEKISGKVVERDALIEELSLPSVEKEIGLLAGKEKNTTLLNNGFTVSALKADIESGNYDKVHIASHGYFGKNAKDSFIMAYDQNLSLLEFKNALEADNLKQEPISLLTLSACKTAEGDDRMLLGFSGLAVKSNVLTAVGSLWSINDEATMEFMRLFYEGIDRSVSKAQAMREAQLSMIKTKKFKHPFFWSPFILIGNWQ